MPGNYHLSDQHYSICIRRARGYCSICYSPVVSNTAANAIEGSSFGLSASDAVPAATAASSTSGDDCTGQTIFGANAAASFGLGKDFYKYFFLV